MTYFKVFSWHLPGGTEVFFMKLKLIFITYKKWSEVVRAEILSVEVLFWNMRF